MQMDKDVIKIKPKLLNCLKKVPSWETVRQ